MEQYRQVRENRLHPITLIWTIPTVAGAVTAFSISKIQSNILNPLTVSALFLLLGGFGFAAVMIFLRHNYFQVVYGLLQQDMDRDRKPLVPMPQFGKDFKKYSSKLLTFRLLMDTNSPSGEAYPLVSETSVDCWEKIGEKFYGIHSWLVVMLCLGLFMILFCLDITNLPSIIRLYFHT